MVIGRRSAIFRNIATSTFGGIFSSRTVFHETAASRFPVAIVNQAFNSAGSCQIDLILNTQNGAGRFLLDRMGFE